MTRLDRLIRRAVQSWQFWRMRRERERAMPELRAHRLRREALRRQHRRGVAGIEEEQRRTLHAAMAGKAGA